MIRVENLSFAYERPILKDVSLEIKEGDFLGILGPNGSGKSTLLKIMIKSLTYEKGEIYVFDKNLKDYSLKEYAKLIGFVPQSSQLFVPLKVIDVLLMGKYLGLKYSFSSYSKEDIDDILLRAKEFKLENFLDRNVFSLSGGEFQRVLLARALLKNPKILFLDEPTSALDLNYAIELLSLCERLVKQKKLTVICILHDLNLASLFCNKLILLKDGEVRHKGGVKELFTKEILKEIYDFSCEIIYKDDKPYILASKEKI